MITEDLADLAREVKRMRTMQRDYYQQRIGLDQCKRQELLVDRMVDEVLNPSLYPPPDHCDDQPY